MVFPAYLYPDKRPIPRNKYTERAPTSPVLPLLLYYKNLLKHTDMKRYVYCLYLLLFSISVFAQDEGKTDVVVKLNGDELNGEVKVMEENAIKFVYSGETLQYTIKKEDIAKIIFKSGRVEVINSPQPANNRNAPADAATTDHYNKVAILPFKYVMDGQQTGEDMALKVQNECFALFNNHAGSYTMLDNHTTNALLIKAGINAQNIAGYTMQELCNILGVAYVISGMVTVDRTSQTAYNSNVQNTTSDKKNDTKKSNSTYGSSYSTNTQNYNTTLTMSIYNDKNQSIFNQDRKAFWHDLDAYKSTLEYLVKRCPLYQK